MPAGTLGANDRRAQEAVRHFVQVSMLDASGSPNGTVFNTTTRNDLGVKLSKPGLAEISTTGFYFNEETGALSKSQITLRALADLSKSGEQSVYVNALTPTTPTCSR
jgi:hypothetical protein